MAGRHSVNRLEQAWLDLAAQSREAIQRSIRLLKETSPPDTFIGRKTQEPFPPEEGGSGNEGCHRTPPH
ncbi:MULTISPECIES: hypothetical protein [unclassified Bradyrhizobium]